MRTLLIASLSSALLAGADLHAQAATVAYYGTGCSYMGQTLALGVQGLPQLNTTFTVTYAGPNFNSTLMIQPMLALGLTPDNTPIPASFLPLQPAGCTALVMPLVITPMVPTPTGPFTTQVAIAVPANPALIGASLVAQWFAIVIQCGIIPPCTFDALPTSNAAVLVVGT